MRFAQSPLTAPARLFHKELTGTVMVVREPIEGWRVLVFSDRLTEEQFRRIEFDMTRVDWWDTRIACAL